VPFKNQHLIRTSLPTSHGYSYLTKPSTHPSTSRDGEKTPFVHLFEFVATIDYSPYLCVPAALDFRNRICGGEAKIRDYCYRLALTGGRLVASILRTHTLDNGREQNMEMNSTGQCCFANVALPLNFRTTRGDGCEGGNAGGEKTFDVEDAGKVGAWINKTAVEEYDTYLQIAFHSGYLWVRLSGQIYLETKDFEWVAHKLNVLCQRLKDEEVTL
jgi:hypothetical protein